VSGSRLEVVLTRSPRTAPGHLATPFYFQTGPIETLMFEKVADWLDYDTINRRQYSRPNSVRLVPLTFDTLFTNYLIEDVPAALEGAYAANLVAMGLSGQSLLGVDLHPFFRQPEERVWQLRKLMTSLTPFVMTMADSSVLRAPAGNAIGPVSASQLSAEVTLRSVKDEQRMGEPDARYVNVSFVEYQPIELAQVRGGSKGTGVTHKLTITKLKDDEMTVRRLARKFYGDASKTKSIFDRNKPWLAHFSGDDRLRAIALGTVPQTRRNKELRALLKKHPQIIVPALTGAAATTRLVDNTYVGI